MIFHTQSSERRIFLFNINHKKELTCSVKVKIFELQSLVVLSNVNVNRPHETNIFLLESLWIKKHRQRKALLQCLKKKTKRKSGKQCWLWIHCFFFLEALPYIPLFFLSLSLQRAVRWQRLCAVLSKKYDRRKSVFFSRDQSSIVEEIYIRRVLCVRRRKSAFAAGTFI